MSHTLGCLFIAPTHLYKCWWPYVFREKDRKLSGLETRNPKCVAKVCSNSLSLNLLICPIDIFLITFISWVYFLHFGHMIEFVKTDFKKAIHHSISSFCVFLIWVQPSQYAKGIKSKTCTVSAWQTSNLTFFDLVFVSWLISPPPPLLLAEDFINKAFEFWFD